MGQAVMFDTINLYQGGNLYKLIVTPDSVQINGTWFANSRIKGVTGTSPLTLSFVNGYLSGSMPAATTSVSGYITSTAFTAFNNKVSSQWGNGTGGIYYNAGKVGLGTSAPLATLDVQGSMFLLGGDGDANNSGTMNGTDALIAYYYTNHSAVYANNAVAGLDIGGLGFVPGLGTYHAIGTFGAGKYGTLNRFRYNMKRGYGYSYDFLLHDSVHSSVILKDSVYMPMVAKNSSMLSLSDSFPIFKSSVGFPGEGINTIRKILVSPVSKLPFEPSLPTCPVDGYVLASSASGTKSWVNKNFLQYWLLDDETFLHPNSNDYGVMIGSYSSVDFDSSLTVKQGAHIKGGVKIDGKLRLTNVQTATSQPSYALGVDGSNNVKKYTWPSGGGGGGGSCNWSVGDTGISYDNRVQINGDLQLPQLKTSDHLINTYLGDSSGVVIRKNSNFTSKYNYDEAYSKIDTIPMLGSKNYEYCKCRYVYISEDGNHVFVYNEETAQLLRSQYGGEFDTMDVYERIRYDISANGKYVAFLSATTSTLMFSSNYGESFVNTNSYIFTPKISSDGRYIFGYHITDDNKGDSLFRMDTHSGFKEIFVARGNYPVFSQNGKYMIMDDTQGGVIYSTNYGSSTATTTFFYYGDPSYYKLCDNGIMFKDNSTDVKRYASITDESPVTILDPSTSTSYYNLSGSEIYSGETCEKNSGLPIYIKFDDYGNISTTPYRRFDGLQVLSSNEDYFYLGGYDNNANYHLWVTSDFKYMKEIIYNRTWGNETSSVGSSPNNRYVVVQSNRGVFYKITNKELHYISHSLGVGME